MKQEIVGREKNRQSFSTKKESMKSEQNKEEG